VNRAKKGVRSLFDFYLETSNLVASRSDQANILRFFEKCGKSVLKAHFQHQKRHSKIKGGRQGLVMK
jgi:hypothetical protein